MSTFPFGKYINVLWAGDDDTQGNYPRALLLEQKSIFAREVREAFLKEKCSKIDPKMR